MSTKAKKRQQKGMDRAEAVMDKKEKKIEKSKGRARTVQERAKAWDDLNKKMLSKKAAQEAFGKEEWVEDDGDMEVEEEVQDVQEGCEPAAEITTEVMATDPEPQSTTPLLEHIEGEVL